MSAELEKAIEAIYSELANIGQKAKELKKNINSLSAMAGKPEPFADVEVSSFIGTASIRPDQFFGKGLSTAVKDFLRLKGRACTALEILDGLRGGGFEFPREWREKFMLKNLSISLGKNRADFVPVPNPNGDGAYGLWEFYPEKKRDREKKAGLEMRALPVTGNNENIGELLEKTGDVKRESDPKGSA